VPLLLLIVNSIVLEMVCLRLQLYVSVSFAFGENQNSTNKVYVTMVIFCLYLSGEEVKQGF